jgi:F-type H+-transporting ATPase subunit c
MLELASFIHFATVAFTVGINSLGAGLGEGIAGYAAMKASNQQPNAHGDIIRTAFIGTALIETTAIVGIFIAALVLMKPNLTLTTQPDSSLYYQSLAELGIALAVCLSGPIIGIVSALPVKEACDAVARQPFFAQKILGFTIITQALVQTPIIAGLIVAILIKKQIPYTACLADALRLIASGLCVGLGGIGPAIGLAQFAKTACRAIGINREAYTTLFSFTLISQTLIETPLIFAFVLSLVMLFFVPTLASDQLLTGVAMIAAALCTGMGTFGTAIGSGNTAASACMAMTHNPTMQATLSRTSMFAQALIETCVIYAILVSLAIIFLTTYL